MKLKKVVKHTNGVRHQINIQKNLLSKYNSIVKNLSFRAKSSGGRNNTGRITVRHRGGCYSKKHILKNLPSSYSIVLNIMYNPKSTAFVTLNFDFVKKIFFKSTFVNNVYSGDIIESSKSLDDLKLGYRSFLKNFPSGSIISNVSNSADHVVYAKSAGTFCQLVEKRKEKIKIKLPSGNLIFVSANAKGTLGYVGNFLNKLTFIGKAGRNRHIGFRPHVRGIAMNPVDHPHGGKSNKGMPQVTPWGIPTKNKPTSKKYKYE